MLDFGSSTRRCLAFQVREFFPCPDILVFMGDVSEAINGVAVFVDGESGEQDLPVSAAVIYLGPRLCTMVHHLIVRCIW